MNRVDLTNLLNSATSKRGELVKQVGASVEECVMFKQVVCGVLLALAATQAQAGLCGGGLCVNKSVDANSTVRLVEYFIAGEEAKVTIDGDGDTDLDVYVYDEFGNLMDSDTDDLDYCIVRFIPRWTGKFVIKVVNLGNVYNEYTICTN